MLKIVIVGYGQMFANLILGCIDSGHNVVGVMRHDRVLLDPASLNIKDFFAPSEDKTFIDSLKLYEIKAHSTNSNKFRKELLRLNPDILLVGSWSEKISKQTLNIPKIASINCHPSLLPKYRGPNPYAQVIINGETKTGISFHLMDSKFDTGAILHQAETPIYNSDTGESLKLRCTAQARKEIQVLLNNLENEIIVPIEQNERYASYQKQLCEKDILIDFNQTSEEIDRKIRGLTPWLKTYITCKNKFFKVGDYKIIENKTNIKEPASIVRKGGKSLQIICADGKLIEFRNLKMLGFLSFIRTEHFIKNIIKINDKAI